MGDRQLEPDSSSGVRQRAGTVHLQRLLDRLEGVKPAKNGWYARCPAHDAYRRELAVVKVGRLVRFRTADLDAFINSRVRPAT